MSAKKDSFEIGNFTLIKDDDDYILIVSKTSTISKPKGYYTKICRITGGDFESILDGLCSVEQVEGEIINE